MRFKLAVLATLILAISAPISWGQVPYVITYEGELTENECLAEGVYAMDFSIWSSLEEGTLIYETSIPDVVVMQGRFTVDLPVDGTAFSASNRYLQLTVDGVTLSPRERITSSAYAMRTRGLWVDEANNVGIKTAADPEASLRVLGDTKLRGDIHVRDQLSLGVADPSVLFGQLTIADSGDGAPFAISAEWDNDSFATIFASNAGSGGVLYAQGASDASPAGGGLIVAGDVAGTNIAIDDNEIMARDGGATSALYLNNDGGDVVVGGTLDLDIQLVTNTVKDNPNVSVSCPAGMMVISGGCRINLHISSPALRASTPFENLSGWSCSTDYNLDDADEFTAYAICARVK